MSLATAGQQITAEGHQLIVVASYIEDEEALAFKIVDALDYDNENDRLLACTIRGMIELAKQRPEDVANVGAHCFVEEGVMKLNSTNGEAASVTDLAKLDTKGSA